jgi:hypothetical protein
MAQTLGKNINFLTQKHNPFNMDQVFSRPNKTRENENRKDHGNTGSGTLKKQET